MFGASSRLECIYFSAVSQTSVRSWVIPQSLIELQGCCCQCKTFCYLKFSRSCQLERICSGALFGVRIESLSIPDSVVALRGKCFSGCSHLRSVTCGALSQLEVIQRQEFIETKRGSADVYSRRCCGISPASLRYVREIHRKSPNVNTNVFY